jgi:hypothetical protein
VVAAFANLSDATFQACQCVFQHRHTFNAIVVGDSLKPLRILRGKAPCDDFLLFGQNVDGEHAAVTEGIVAADRLIDANQHQRWFQ